MERRIKLRATNSEHLSPTLLAFHKNPFIPSLGTPSPATDASSVNILGYKDRRKVQVQMNRRRIVKMEEKLKIAT